jgi:hypothetical protein
MFHSKTRNMNKLIYLIVLVPLMLSCVSQTEYDKLKAEKEKLQNDYDNLLEEKRQIEIVKNSKKHFSETEVLSILKDYYDFYNREMVYRNPKIRRVDSNSFKISLDIRPKKAPNENFFWDSTVLTLVINNDGSYKIN